MEGPPDMTSSDEDEAADTARRFCSCSRPNSISCPCSVRSRVRARRVVRAEDLVTVEGEEREDSSSSDTDEDGTPTGTHISERAKAVSILNRHPD